MIGRSLYPTMKRTAAFLLFLTSIVWAAAPNRIRGVVDARRPHAIPGNIHPLAQPRFDRGPVDPGLRLQHVLLLMKPSAGQQASLDQLLMDQQNPSSPLFHRWLTPEEFGSRFGLSPADHSKVVAWLASAGLTVDESGRSRNWVAFSGTASQIGRALHTGFRRYEADGETHFANSSAPSVPEALADVAGGFLGLNDFHPKPGAVRAAPRYNSGSAHYLVPEDFATIYDLAPLYQAGIDGTGQSIAVVGQSDIVLSDIRAFRSKYKLPANDPKLLNYGGGDPGLNSAQLEANLDLEWAGAAAPGATIFYVYGPNAFTALVSAVNLNNSQIVSVSYSTCEVNASIPYYQFIAQQANAQGITILAGSGDAGAAACDTQGSEPLATRGLSVNFPAVLPEVTGVGGTQFVEGSGTYWAAANDANSGSALSYIPEAAWNESATTGLAAAGGGASRLYAKPIWQSGPGVPADKARDVPDVSLSAATHDAYEVYISGLTIGVGGTSASTPSMAGILALLNHYLVKQGVLAAPGLGNINPQLYRLAQTAPGAFHDVVAGNISVPCSESSPDCLTGTLGYAAGPGYDLATGLGSIDANLLATQWNQPVKPAAVQLTASAAKGTLNDTVQLTAAVTGSGSAPTGTVAFSSNGNPLGTVTLSSGAATLQAPLYLSGTGTWTYTASYSGDNAYAPGGATVKIQVTAPAGAAAIVPSAPGSVWPSFPDAEGPTWQTDLSLRETAGVAAMVTAFTIDGVAQALSQYFPAPSIPANGTLTTVVSFRNLAAPLSHTFGFSGVDVTGASWSRQVAVTYLPLPESFNFTLMGTPLVIAQNPTADPSCQWPVQLNVDEQSGFLSTLSAFYVGGANEGNVLSNLIVPTFGTTRLDAWDGLQGVYCFSGVTPGTVSNIEVDLSNGLIEQLTVAFVGAPANPTKLSATPANIVMNAGGSAATVQGTLAVGIADKTQSWSAMVFPANRATSWLSLSQVSGTGPAQITLTANAAGLEPGAYRATIALQSPNATPQVINVPVMMVFASAPANGTVLPVQRVDPLPSPPNIAAVVNAASNKPAGSPGTLMTVYGTNLSVATATASGTPLPYTLGGVTATVNNMPAPLLYVSPTQINLQVPYSAGMGPSVLGINNNGAAGGFQLPLAASSPAIYLNADGSIAGSSSVQQGGYATLYLDGAGEVTPPLKSAYATGSGTPVSIMPKPVLPLSVTVGGVPCTVTFAGISTGLIGTVQVNINVPASVPAGVQPVVVTVGGLPSPAGNITVTAAQ